MVSRILTDELQHSRILSSFLIRVNCYSFAPIRDYLLIDHGNSQLLLVLFIGYPAVT
jgi:hypothetical protein